ncbi:LytR/AlgR family response regulator transcription factor [Clostridium beijerinckii]|uniref:Stage 0 sporulation protein A homolog n=1 Tax=Clostridium beijerinckii TaxID=1520 RepID=A0A1S8RZ32_CLOBE|nr:LytTR family DNA-binding domain-containing protein [Clostridium beijerinckii]NRY61539.1 DNA-binding LytR/AlgR family response regulator [Clostridium beijerinckii]OOM58462.1 sensory transduction protein LytR [Clostridium beijerinckii]
MINVLIIEDSKIQKTSFLANLLSKARLDFNIYKAFSRDELLRISKDVHIDLFFIDSDEQSSGLDFAIEIRSIEMYRTSYIIFLSKNINYMIQAFKEVHCYDYILKPYNPKELIEIIKKAREILIKEKHNYNAERRVRFNNKDIDIIISTADIIYIEVNIRNCIIHTKNKVFEISRLTLKRALEIINESFIIKSHKSFAININYIREIKRYSVTSWSVEFKDYKFSAIISSKYKYIIDKALNINMIRVAN